MEFYCSSSSSITSKLVTELLLLCLLHAHSPKPGRRESAAELPDPLPLPCHLSSPGDPRQGQPPPTAGHTSGRFKPRRAGRHPKPRGPAGPARGRGSSAIFPRTKNRPRRLPRRCSIGLALPDTSCQQRNPGAPGIPGRLQGLALTLGSVRKLRSGVGRESRERDGDHARPVLLEEDETATLHPHPLWDEGKSQRGSLKLSVPLWKNQLELSQGRLDASTCESWIWTLAAVPG